MSKTEADHLKKIQIWWLLKDMKNRLIKEGEIFWGENGSEGSIGYKLWLTPDFPRLALSYTVGEEKKEIKYVVPLLQSDCNFGSTRFWFQCSIYKNGERCGRRVGVIYKAGDYFACRHCYELTYKSRNENTSYKYGSLFKAIKIAHKMEELEKKTKRMTWRGHYTKKFQKLLNLRAKLDTYHEIMNASGEYDEFK
jgi:hypothetical protein